MILIFEQEEISALILFKWNAILTLTKLFHCDLSFLPIIEEADIYNIDASVFIFEKKSIANAAKYYVRAVYKASSQSPMYTIHFRLERHNWKKCKQPQRYYLNVSL